MRKVKSVGVFSVAKMTAAITACVSLIFVPFMLIAVLLGGLGAASDSNNPFAAMGAVVGIIVVLLIPVIYGIVGFLAGLLQGFVYNLVAKRLGGIEIELEPS